MPAPIEVFHEANQQHRERLKNDFLAMIGGGVLAAVGVSIEQSAVALGGAAIAFGSSLKMAFDTCRHERQLHRLNMVRPTEGGL